MNTSIEGSSNKPKREESLELEDLILGITEVLEETIELALRIVRGLVTRDGLHHGRRTADHDEVVIRGSRDVLLDDLLRNVTDRSFPVLRGLLENVVHLEVLVLGSALIDLLTEQDILLSNVGENEGNLSLIISVSQDGISDLQHGGQTSTSGNKTNLLLGVSLVRILGDGTLHLNNVSNLQIVNGRRKLTILVLLDEKLSEANSISIERSVGADDCSDQMDGRSERAGGVK